MFCIIQIYLTLFIYFVGAAILFFYTIAKIGADSKVILIVNAVYTTIFFVGLPFVLRMLEGVCVD